MKKDCRLRENRIGRYIQSNIGFGTNSAWKEMIFIPI